MGIVRWATKDFDDVEKRMSCIAYPVIRPGLSRIARLLKYLGHPERSFRAIHVVGTNGKGSTAASVESVLRETGLKTALYTSPHLVHFGERLRIGGEIVSPGKWNEAIDVVESVLRKICEKPTFFEVSTAAAFMIVASEEVDMAVVEAGLGGRLDATNILRNVAVSVLTSVGLDHMEYLGETPMAVAAEKFSVLRPNGKSCFAGGDVRLERAYQNRCLFLKNQGIVTSRFAKWKVRKVDLSGTISDAFLFGESFRNLKTGLVGRYQALNAMNAIVALRLLSSEGVNVTKEQIQKGFRRVRLPGRFDIRLLEGGTVILDGAHNPHGINALVEAVSELVPRDALSVVFASMKDKDYRKSLSLLKKLEGKLFLTQVPGMDRSATTEELKEAAVQAGWDGIRTIDTPGKALKEALEAGGTVLCCGSLYLVAEILKKNISVGECL